MSRWVIFAFLACGASVSAQNIPPPRPPEPPAAPTPAPAAEPARPNADELKRERPKPRQTLNPKEEVPPEEDTSLSTDVIGFNPLQAQKDITAGNFYYKKGSFRSAFNRYKQATLHDDSNGEAWLRMAGAAEKLKDRDAEKEAYTKYLAVAGDSKNAAEIRKKLEKLK